MASRDISRWHSSHRGDGLPSRLHGDALKRIATGTTKAKREAALAEEAKLPKVAEVVEDDVPAGPPTLRVASLSEIPTDFVKAGTGMYRQAHSVWALRAAEDEKGGYVLTRLHEEPDVDMMQPKTASTQEEQKLLGLIKQANELPEEWRIYNYRVAFVHEGQVQTGVVLDVDINTGHVQIKPDEKPKGVSIVMPMEMLVGTPEPPQEPARGSMEPMVTPPQSEVVDEPEEAPEAFLDDPEGGEDLEAEAAPEESEYADEPEGDDMGMGEPRDKALAESAKNNAPENDDGQDGGDIEGPGPELDGEVMPPLPREAQLEDAGRDFGTMWDKMPGTERWTFVRSMGTRAQDWLRLSWMQLPPAAKSAVANEFRKRRNQKGTGHAEIVKKALAVRAVDMHSAWGKFVTPSQSFKPILMGEKANKIVKGSVYEVEGSSMADPQLDRMYGIPRIMLPHPQAHLSVLDDRVRLINKESGQTVFVTPVELEQFFVEADYKDPAAARNPKVPLDRPRDMPDRTPAMTGPGTNPWTSPMRHIPGKPGATQSMRAPSFK